jgi:hypothetical protein
LYVGGAPPPPPPRVLGTALALLSLTQKSEK